MAMTERRQDEYQARKICAWCGRDLGPSPTREDSHGICPGCERKFWEQARRDREERQRRQRQ